MKRPDRVLLSPGTRSPSGPGETIFHYHPVGKRPVGELAIAYTPTPFRIHSIFLPQPGLERWEHSLPADRFRLSRCKESSQWADRIRDYLSGSPDAPGPVPWEILHLEPLTDLQAAVLRATARIPFGRTASYSAIAEAIGRPRACRFVGSALARNPFPILIPCHRVIRSDGSPGEFGGGRALKKWLLSLECSST